MKKRRWAQHHEKGQGLVEYALILVLVAVVVIVVLTLLGPAIGNVFSNVISPLQRAAGGGGGGSSTPTSSTFSGTITAGDSNDGAGRYFDVCTFTVSTTGSYSFASVTTSGASNNFWVTGGPTSMTVPAAGFTMHIQKPTTAIIGANLTAGTTYEAYPHSTAPAEFPVTYQFTFSGPGTVTGSCP